MCGIAGAFGQGWDTAQVEAMSASLRHRGPDDEGLYVDPAGLAALGHTRLSIIDLSAAGHQPMADPSGRYWIAFNGEVYNFVELRRELRGEFPFRTRTDTEVLLAAYLRWGSVCLDRLVGMFAFAIWDQKEQSLFAARDRFGVKPLYYHATPDGTLLLASEIKALLSAGVATRPDPVAWATYLTYGLYDHTERTFWQGVSSLRPGYYLTWRDGALRIARWYDLAARVGAEWDARPVETVQEEYSALLHESVRLRFRSDVPVGINLSGGLDSSTLLGVVQAVRGPESDVKVFTFVTGDPRYDELPWVQQLLSHARHPLVVCPMEASEVPALASSVQAFQDEPFGGLPTLAYARLFERARAEGVIVLLDGNGMDEQWAGYDYYTSPAGQTSRFVQGLEDSPVQPECLMPEFRALAEPFDPPRPFADPLRNLQYRDACYTKIPRSLRFNDRISMRESTELRQPFLDHRLFELALRQPLERKIAHGKRKWLLRQIARRLLPAGIPEAPKRPLQTPQREWLRGPLRAWAGECVAEMLDTLGGTWLDKNAVRGVWGHYLKGAGDNSFYVWQWIGLQMHQELWRATA